MIVAGRKILLVIRFISHERFNCYGDLLYGFYEITEKVLANNQKESVLILKVDILKVNKATF